MPLKLDLWLEWINDCKYLPENDLRELCDYVADILIEEPNIISTAAPITVCGDVHGQFYDVEELFRTGGLIPNTKYIFMGDFVDRGYYSLETWTKLIILKAKYPNHIFLIRGNHESRGITQSYGFYDECIRKYGNANPWKFCCKLFDLLSIAALIDNSVLCVHGGLSPLLNTLEMIQVIERKVEVPNKGGFCDLLWSDPEDVENWEVSPRGAGWLFGETVTKEFMHINNISLICRAHQLVNEGYKFMFGEKLVTVWSAPNYCYRCGNIASIMEFKTATNHRPLLFDAVQSHNRKVPPTQTIPYFL